MSRFGTAQLLLQKFSKAVWCETVQADVDMGSTPDWGVQAKSKYQTSYPRLFRCYRTKPLLSRSFPRATHAAKAEQVNCSWAYLVEPGI